MGPNISTHRETRLALDAIRRIVQALRESSRQAEKQVGLTGAQLFVLQALAQAPAVALNDLAAATHTHQSSVSTVVARLVERGLVQRDRAEADRRRLVLTLSAQGRRTIAGAPDLAQQRLVRSIEALGDRQRRDFADTLVAVARSTSSHDRAPAMFFEEGAGAHE